MLKFKLFLLIAFTIFLASCGSTEEPCTQSGFGLFTTWKVSGGEYLAKGINGKVGVPLSAKPIHDGIPASCVGKGDYQMRSGYALPAGLVLNPKTGEISGLPTAAGHIGRGTSTGGVILLYFPGFETPGDVLFSLDVN